MKSNSLTTGLTVSIASILLATSAMAQDNTMTLNSSSASSADSDSWQFGVSVPLWAAGITGTGTIKGRQRNVDITFKDLWDHLDTSLALGASARKGRLGFFGDVGYMKFSAGGSLPLGGNTALGLKFVIADAGVAYQIFKTESEHPFALDATLGLRYWYADNFIKVKDAGNVVLFDGTF